MVGDSVHRPGARLVRTSTVTVLRVGGANVPRAFFSALTEISLTVLRLSVMGCAAGSSVEAGLPRRPRRWSRS